MNRILVSIGFLAALMFGNLPSAEAQSQVVAWGDNASGQCNVPDLPPGLSYAEVSAAGLVNLSGPGSFGKVAARRSDGSIIEWGATSGTVPSLPPGLTYVEVAAGQSHSVARRSDGSVVAWGDNSAGQCDIPALPPGLTYVEIAVGMGHTMALRSDGSVVAWGVNYAGQCDVPDLPPGTTYVQIAAGGFNSAGIRSDGSLVVWGEDHFGGTNVPALPLGIAFVQISVGSGYNLGLFNDTVFVALRSDGSAVAWGLCAAGGWCDVPALPPGALYVEVAAGMYHLAARRSDGWVVAWGGNDFGQCEVPALPPGYKYAELDAGGATTVARIDTSVPVTPFCFGDDPAIPCPCDNAGLKGRGCDNSSATGGARLSWTGNTWLSHDTLHLTASGERPSALSVFWQGGSESDPYAFGDGLGCMGGPLTRLFSRKAVGGIVSSPQGIGLSVSARSAALGAPIAPGSLRVYHVLYRDPDPDFCSFPLGAEFNITNGLRVIWGQ